MARSSAEGIDPVKVLDAVRVMGQIQARTDAYLENRTGRPWNVGRPQSRRVIALHRKVDEARQDETVVQAGDATLSRSIQNSVRARSRGLPVKDCFDFKF
jgi:hypothetical protein